MCMYTIIFVYVIQRNNGKINHRLPKGLPVAEVREQGALDKDGS